MKNKVSIIVPIYNSEKFLDCCIKSVISQTYKNIELILINDGSNDNSEDICIRYANNDNRIKYLYKDNSGVSDTRNTGIKMASGKYIFFLDSDDFIDKDVIESLINSYEKNTLIGVKNRILYKFHSPIIEKRNDTYKTSEFFESILKSDINGYCVSFLYEKKKLLKIEFNKKISYCEDIIFLYNYLNYNEIKHVKFIKNNCFYNYFVNDDSVTKSKKDIINKIKSINYSMDYLNMISNYNYNEYICIKKVKLFESEIQKDYSMNILKNITSNYRLVYNSGLGMRYKVFYILFKNKKITLLRFYYLIRKLIKSIKEFL